MASSSNPPQGSAGSVDPDSTVDALNIPGPYSDLTLHARGGLGEVFRATDPQLHRTVALKLLQDRHANNPDSRQRAHFLISH